MQGRRRTAGGLAYIHRIVFPLEANLYGRSLSAAAPAHRFLPGAKGGLYLWEQVRQCPEVILVEGLFDYGPLPARRRAADWIRRWVWDGRSLACRRMLHVPLRPAMALGRACTDALSISIRLSCRSAKNPTKRLSGGQKGNAAPLVSGGNVEQWSRRRIQGCEKPPAEAAKTATRPSGEIAMEAGSLVGELC
jgi:hypothetical protein